MKTKGRKKLFTLMVAAVIFITGVVSFSVMNQSTKPIAAAKPLATNPSDTPFPTKAELNIPSGEIAQAIKAKNWELIDHKFIDGKLKPEDREKLLGQVIFSIDSAYVEVADHPRLMNLLLTIASSDAHLTARGKILLSKAIGKLKLDKSQMKKVTSHYTKNKWVNSQHWLDATIEWDPIPKSTIKNLGRLFKKDRSDLLSDYFYYLRKVKDPLILKQQIMITKNKMKSLPEQQQQFVKNQLQQIEKNP